MDTPKLIQEFAPIFAWRDQIYRQHRGGPVKP